MPSTTAVISRYAAVLVSGPSCTFVITTEYGVRVGSVGSTYWNVSDGTVEAAPTFAGSGLDSVAIRPKPSYVAVVSSPCRSITCVTTSSPRSYCATVLSGVAPQPGPPAGSGAVGAPT